MASTALVWFRNDLRLSDHPALQAALNRYDQVIPLYIYSPEEESFCAPGAASRSFLHYSLKSLQQDLLKKNAPLILRRGKAQEIIDELIAKANVQAVYVSECCEEVLRKRDEEIKKKLALKNVDFRTFSSSTLLPLGSILNQSQKPFLVFTAFYKKLLEQSDSISSPLAEPSSMGYSQSYPSLFIEDLKLLPSIKWDEGFYDSLQAGEQGARKNLEVFMTKISSYKTLRDEPAISAQSQLSAYLHVGAISPRQIWYRVQAWFSEQKEQTKAQESAHFFLRELVWREFAQHFLYFFPHTAQKSFKSHFDEVKWEEDEENFTKWKKGKTGFPIVDAGMRELWHTGLMHNRVRMIVASFLVKDLLIHWKKGADYFWQTLIDADLANNSMGWQWVAGCGVDAAPYFRIFNPVLQGEKFDVEGKYVKKWLPELKDLDAKYIHQPWLAPLQELKKAQIKLGENYPFPIVDHSFARKRALERIKLTVG